MSVRSNNSTTFACSPPVQPRQCVAARPIAESVVGGAEEESSRLSSTVDVGAMGCEQLPPSGRPCRRIMDQSLFGRDISKTVPLLPSIVTVRCHGRANYQGWKRDGRSCWTGLFGARATLLLLYTLLAVILCCLSGVEGFRIPLPSSHPLLPVASQSGSRHASNCLLMAKTKQEIHEEEDFEEEIGDDADTGSVVLDDLNWRVAKQRLEEQNTRRFLKSRPRFLPYDECRRWVQAWGQRWQSEEEWREWIRMGEKRNSYIPSEPDKYYGRLNQWISWEHFLGVEKE